MSPLFSDIPVQSRESDREGETTNPLPLTPTARHPRPRARSRGPGPEDSAGRISAVPTRGFQKGHQLASSRSFLTSICVSLEADPRVVETLSAPLQRGSNSAKKKWGVSYAKKGKKITFNGQTLPRRGWMFLEMDAEECRKTTFPFFLL